MPETKHTPTPWEAERHGAGPQWAIKMPGTFGYIALTAQGDDEANARFIVTAVNAHSDLVSALKAARDLFEDQWDRMDWRKAGPVGEKIRAALAKADPTA